MFSNTKSNPMPSSIPRCSFNPGSTSKIIVVPQISCDYCGELITGVLPSGKIINRKSFNVYDENFRRVDAVQCCKCFKKSVTP